MILEILLKTFLSFADFIVGLIPKFTFLDKLIEYKNLIITFFTEPLGYALWFFDTTILLAFLGVLIAITTMLFSRRCMVIFAKAIPVLGKLADLL